MAWVQFSLSAAAVIFVASKMTQYAHVIAVRTRLGGMFVGTLLVAAATSAPEIITNVSSVRLGALNLAAGDLFGSGMFNMLILALLDVVHFRKRILRRVAVSHALTAALATLLTGMAALFVLARIPWRIGWLGLDSLSLIVIYVGGVWLIQKEGRQHGIPVGVELDVPGLGLTHAIIGFVASAVVLAIISPWLVRAAKEIALITGLGTGFVGVTLFAFVTSLPEVVTMLVSVRLGAFDMTVGDLFGSNIFNMLALAITDGFYVQGLLFSDIDANFALAGLLVVLLINLALVGNLARLERRLWFVELDALLIILSFIGGMLLLYQRGIGM
jgi:cation:H+ antiporter